MEFTDKQLEAIRRMNKLPVEIREHILSYVPKPYKPKPPAGLQRELDRLQKSPKQNAMYLKGLDDFVIQ